MNNIANTDAPVVVLNCKLGGLAIMRTLGACGIHVIGVDSEADSPGFLSRYCREKVLASLDLAEPQQYLDTVLAIGRRVGGQPILIPTSDDHAIFVSEYGEQLREVFRFPYNSPELMHNVSNKKRMFELATQHQVPTADTQFPENLDELMAVAGKTRYPVMLKAIHGDSLQARTGVKMVIVEDREQLIDEYQRLEDPAAPNLMVQEMIPGGDDQVYIFNGYFDQHSECLVGYTGFKVRQAPIHKGSASLGECRWNETVARQTIQFMQALGYRGILDIGFRLDPRDGKYKVLDINPRVGQAFRMFVSPNNMDVVRALYLDLTGQAVTADGSREGRRWVIEDYDLVSTLHYHQEGSMGFWDWVKSFKGLEEAAWFSWRDPKPFLQMAGRFSVRLVRWLFKQKKKAGTHVPASSKVMQN